MCSERILCRLRLRPNYRHLPKRSLKEVLREAIHSLAGAENASLSVGRAKEVIRLVDAWAKHQTLTRLEELVEGIHDLREVRELRSILEAIPSRTMHTDSKENL